MDGPANNSVNSSTTRLGKDIPCRYYMLKIWKFEDIPCRYYMLTIWKLDHIENKDASCLWKDCMKKALWFFKRAHKNIIYFEKNVTINERRIKTT